MVGIICTPALVEIGLTDQPKSGVAMAPPAPLAPTALEAGCMSQAITNAAKAEVGLDRRIMQSYPLIYQSSAPLNESNAQISRGAEKNNI